MIDKDDYLYIKLEEPLEKLYLYKIIVSEDDGECCYLLQPFE